MRLYANSITVVEVCLRHWPENVVSGLARTHSSDVWRLNVAPPRLAQIADTVSGTITRQYDVRFDTPTQEVTPV